MSRTIAGYTLPHTLNEMTPLQQKASQVKRDFEQQVAQIRENRTLTADGKRVLIARAWQPFKVSFDALQRQDSEGYSRAKRDQRMKLVGLKDRSDPSAIVGFRDAMQRAESLPSSGLDESSRRQQEAAVQSLLNTADLAGDDVLARAVLCVAIDRGITTVVDRYKEQYPHEADDISDYNRLLEFDPTVTMQSHYLWQVRRPKEIGTYDMNDEKIAQVASEPIGLNDEALATAQRHEAYEAAATPVWMTAQGQAQARAAMQNATRIDF